MVDNAANAQAEVESAEFISSLQNLPEGVTVKSASAYVEEVPEIKSSDSSDDNEAMMITFLVLFILLCGFCLYSYNLVHCQDKEADLAV